MSQYRSLPAFVSRQDLDVSSWNACISTSPQRIVYGYSWYLDAVLPSPDWQWMGLVLHKELGGYQAVMPVPLRRKRVAGVTRWVVHQPFFCQFLSIFSSDRIVDPTPFLSAIQQRFRHGSVLNLSGLSSGIVVTREESRTGWLKMSRAGPRSQAGNKEESRTGWLRIAGFLPRYGNAVELAGSELQIRTNYVLDLSVGYKQLSANYSRDRRLNLQRAKAADWTIVESTDVKPLLALFRENHADTIKGGVADWTYDVFEKLSDELHKRDLCLMRYAIRQGTIEAGALFVREGNRIIYLFNAASKMGRQKNARTLLIDQVIRAYTGQHLIFDFESPQKSSIASFYRSFGATAELFHSIRWSRLTVLERAFLRVRRLLLAKPEKGNT